MILFSEINSVFILMIIIFYEWERRVYIGYYERDNVNIYVSLRIFML